MLLTEAFDNPSDSRMGKNRIYANFSLGPFNFEPDSSIKIVMAEFVGGASYSDAINPSITREQIEAKADSAIDYLTERVKFNFDHQYTVPMPPPAPAFSVDAIDSAAVVANLITFDNSSELIQDPHGNGLDIAGYRIYRSWNFSFGPWSRIADITVGDANFFDPITQSYTYIDRKVALGFGYHYSVTAYDNGDPSWDVDTQVSIPPLESSVFANRTKGGAFLTTLKSQERTLDEISVVPNPFYRNSGLQMQGSENFIFFVNLSKKCTIRIYTVRGDLVKTIQHNDPNSGVTFWNQISDNGQYVKSGMYFYLVENEFGDQKGGKFSIIK
jgi:hypothetical protein